MDGYLISGHDFSWPCAVVSSPIRKTSCSTTASSEITLFLQATQITIYAELPSLPSLQLSLLSRCSGRLEVAV
jgi:hypothetical protein